ncbi:MAG: helix-turn-helix domain-containing protein [Bifidobacterium tibiigranuli]|jgi:transcriptional regulator with XRE-family HTH domain|uniref:helix-turn-helix domain-containing protein n=1 Tax=Bifidobacterium tibiigranuli TaxID=2172043 RepID=UPI0026E94E56|nr:helix-turn-helix transcriptional regulator [Bifidobacterium tibiigranuli]MCI1649160.1 helix-turn-helix domain-containing protein [Bifidobacterium tibiigranuli]MCI2185578.1 helix-turn-helix domain-containing protein [Bifidobacterium tibiigranuli]
MAWEVELKTGELIKKYRKLRKMTQKQLAAACGQTDSAIRNYELGNRTPGELQLQTIAKALYISSEALREVPLESSRQALELLFRLDEEFGLEPMEVDGMLVLGFDARAEKSPKLAVALKAWKKMLDSENAGEITPEELDEWKAEFGS